MHTWRGFLSDLKTFTHGLNIASSLKKMLCPNHTIFSLEDSAAEKMLRNFRKPLNFTGIAVEAAKSQQNESPAWRHQLELTPGPS